jgi:hypothetical protein
MGHIRHPSLLQEVETPSMVNVVIDRSHPFIIKIYLD